jgi:Domain of unknown function (DUF427)
VVFAGVTVADSKNVMLFGQSGSVTERQIMRPGAIPSRCLKDHRFKGIWRFTGIRWMPGFCEEQQVYAHARDPYKRVDILPSSRHVRILLGGVTIAETHHPLLLLETGLPAHYYIPMQDMRMECLEPTETTA